MGNWKYYQLIAGFYRSLFNLIAQGVKINDAAHRARDDYYFFPEKEHMISNFVTKIQYINVLLSLDVRINDELLNSFYLDLDGISKITISDYLDEEEVEHFEDSIADIKYRLNALKNDIYS